jgi:hypothetical protein
MMDQSPENAAHGDGGHERAVSDLERVAGAIRRAGGPVEGAVASLLEQVAYDHATDLCGYCNTRDGVPGTCPVAAAADHVAFVWMLERLKP